MLLVFQLSGGQERSRYLRCDSSVSQASVLQRLHACRAELTATPLHLLPVQVPLAWERPVSAEALEQRLLKLRADEAAQRRQQQRAVAEAEAAKMRALQQQMECKELSTKPTQLFAAHAAKMRAWLQVEEKATAAVRAQQQAEAERAATRAAVEKEKARVLQCAEAAVQKQAKQLLAADP